MNAMRAIFISIFLASTIYASEKPKWINEAAKGCSKKEICAVGEGLDRNQAEASANAALAKIFQNKIKTNFKSHLQNSNSEINESVSEEIEEVTDTILEGVETKSVFKDGDKLFALVALNKPKAASPLKKQIDTLDDKIKGLLADKKLSNLIEIEKSFLKREEIENRYQFLSGIDIPAPISYEKIIKLKNELIKEVVVHISLNETAPKNVENILASELTTQGFKVTKGSTLNSLATHIVKGEVVFEKQYMEVDGFVKYILKVKLTSSNLKNINLGELMIDITETGRSSAQVYDKAITSFKNELKDKISELKFN